MLELDFVVAAAKYFLTRYLGAQLYPGDNAHAYPSIQYPGGYLRVVTQAWPP